jgi:transposase
MYALPRAVCFADQPWWSGPMTRKTDNELAATLKAKVALAALRGDKTLTELAMEFNLDPAQIDEWRKQLEQKAEATLRSDVPPSEAPTMRGSAPLAKSPTLPTPPTHDLLDDEEFWKEETLRTSGVKTSMNVAPRVAPPPRDKPSPVWMRNFSVRFSSDGGRSNMRQEPAAKCCSSMKRLPRRAPV